MNTVFDNTNIIPTPIPNNSKRIISKVVAISLIFGLLSGSAGTILALKYGQKYFANAAFGSSVNNNLDSSKDQANSENTSQTTLKVIEDSATIDVVKKASTSVVSIIISKDLPKYNNIGSGINPLDNFFNFGFPTDLFNNGSTQPITPNPSTDQNTEKQKTTIGGGSGFIITADGMILTNRHVVADDTADYTVVTNDGKEYKAKVLAKDTLNDLAIIKIDATNLVPIELGNSDDLQIGQTVIAIGNTLGEYKNTVTKGVISGKNRKVEASDGNGSSETIVEALQTDAAINPGNSGGPLLNLAGQVVGINTAVNQQGQSIGFAIPINVAKKSIESVKKNGRIVRPYLGVRSITLNADIAKKNNLKKENGALIIGDTAKGELGVVNGSPAQKAGLVDGDIILSVNGEEINADKQLPQLVAKYAPGDEITLKVYSKDAEKEIKVKLDEFKN